MAATDFIGLLLRNAERERRLKEAFKARGAELVSMYRRGPYAVEALYSTGATLHGARYWTIKAYVTGSRAWTQDDLDREIYDQLVRALDEHIHGSEEIDAHAGWGASG